MTSTETFQPTKTTELPDGTIVRASQIIGTPSVMLSAWRLAPGGRGYTTIAYVEGLGWLGRIGTEQLPDEIAALEPNTNERALAATTYYQHQRLSAIAAIEQAYPGVTDTCNANGDIHAFKTGEILVRRDTLEEISA